MRLTLALACLALSTMLIGQAPERMTSSEIHTAIKKLGVVGSALYVAAHPDDENTRLISYLANQEKVSTTYLSMTRGDGGQNLVGPEIREYLGIIRTQELMMARNIDGGNQMFTRANDFGYSKTPEETLDFWNQEEVLADVVWAIRKTRPDVIVNRFPHEHLDGNHGHHTTSAMLSYEAFDLAGDPNAYPEQLKYVDTWQPKRLFFNTSWWFYGSPEKFEEEADMSKMAQVDVGVYYPEMAISNPEIAALSRSMHKSQGFGSSGSRGSQKEYLELIKGDMPPDKGDLFDGIDITWSRLGDYGHIQDLIAQIYREFDHVEPFRSIPQLFELKSLISKIDAPFWRDKKIEEVDQIILACLGLYTDARADDHMASPGDSIDLQVELTNRANVPVTLVSAKFGGTELVDEMKACEANDPVMIRTRVKLDENTEYTSAYWLRETGSEGMYTVNDQQLRGLPENPRSLGVRFVLSIDGKEIDLFRPLVYQTTDPVKGEVYRPFEVVPPVFVNFNQSIQVIADDGHRTIQLRVKSARDSVEGQLSIHTPEGWSIEPLHRNFSMAQKGDESVFEFDLIPPANQDVGTITAEAQLNGKTYTDALINIEHDHIPAQTVLEKATAKVVRVDLKRTGNRIGYVMGAGDDIPASLEQVGYMVDVLDENQIDLRTLKQYDAIVLGIRAYNVSERIRFYQDDLFEYVKEGGTLITQYNTHRSVKADDLAPIPITVSRDRVTDETADVTILAEDHPALHYPNEITSEDFDMWVQERGLYFPNEWDEGYTALLRMHDPGAEPSDGSLLIARYGEGYFIYTGLSWFRQLPAGVPGAYRLFTNLLSLGNGSKS